MKLKTLCLIFFNTIGIHSICKEEVVRYMCKEKVSRYTINQENQNKKIESNSIVVIEWKTLHRI